MGLNLLDSPSFSATAWQMSFGERAVIEGVLTQLRPRLALEIGTAEGGSLSRIAAYSEKVISFDLIEPQAGAKALPNVELRTGDSHDLLPRELKRIEEASETIDFVLVDGDHTADGARRDMEDLLASPAVSSTVILAHDTLNQDVRRGLEAVPYVETEKVAFVDLDFVGGYVPAQPPLKGECWGGLGVVIVDESRRFSEAHGGREGTMAPLSELIWPAAAALRGAGNGESPVAELDRYRDLVNEIESSTSWRLTAPLRAARRLLRSR
jgi:methyltransferase family protein